MSKRAVGGYARAAAEGERRGAEEEGKGEEGRRRAGGTHSLISWRTFETTESPICFRD